ncbi:MAG: ABC transporter substrate-binding protein [Alcaligenaceae bacterium]|nr:ABC transporter substrate-binding protein [Alcaligenaceae bacterium]
MKATQEVSKLFSMLQKALLIGAVTFSGQVMAEEVKVQHAKGETSVQVPPAKTAVFDLASLDTMQALGVKAAGVPKAKFPDQFSDYRDESIARVGSLFEPDHDALKQLAPDLVIIGGRSSAKYDDVSKLAPTIDMTVDTSKGLSSIEANVRTLAKIYKKEAEAEAALKKLSESVDALKAKSANAGSAMVVLAIDDKTSTFGPGSRFGQAYDIFGFTPVAAVKDLSAKDRHPVKLEDIVKADPDWIFVIDRHAATGTEGKKPVKETLDNSILKDTRAAKSQQIVYLDPYNWYILGSAGLNSLQQSVEQVSAALDKK